MNQVSLNIATYILGTIAGMSLLSVLIKRPWTILIARRHTPPEVWSTDLFLETNMIISGAWTLLFALAAFLSIILPLWANLMVGVIFFLLGRLSPRFGLWYSSKRMKSLFPKPK